MRPGARRARITQASLAAALLCRVAIAAPAQTLPITYLSLDTTHPLPSTKLDPPPTDTGLRGAELAAADNNTTGRFTGQVTTLDRIAAREPDTIVAAFARALAAGSRLFVTDVPADLLLRLADTPNAAAALILDATTADDRLRAQDCRANTLHTLPSRAMLADALMQYLAARDWRRIFLLTGRDPEDGLTANAFRAAAEKFQITIQADRPWTFNPTAQQADTGHSQVNDEVKQATQGISYDVLVVADGSQKFGNDLAYRTDMPRPVAGTQGLVPAAWSPVMDEYASTQLQTRFRRLAARAMTVRDYGAWLAVRAIGEAATRTASTDPARIVAYMRGPDFALSGYKGPELSFRSWDGQMRQPVLLADDRSLVSISPQPGFLHETNELDSLGVDQPETRCRK